MLRALARSAERRRSFAVGGVAGPQTLDGLLADLAAVRARTSTAAPASTSVYNQNIVGGASTIGVVSGRYPYYRIVRYSAYTSCQVYSSDSEAQGEMDMYQKAKNNVTTFEGAYDFRGLGTYASGYYEVGVSGDYQYAVLRTRHICDVWWTWSDPYKYTSTSRYV
jgi:hypothetical protein